MFTIGELTYFEKCLLESNEKGVKIRAVILCNPHNPRGRVYPKEVIIEYCKFCEKHNLHLISDEIYALSIFPSRDVPNPPPFVSALSLDLKVYDIDPSRLHVVYGMSKDFNCNGFRIGALITQHNQTLIRSLAAAAFFSMVSSPASSPWTTLLNDEKFLPYFIRLNQLKLQGAYEYLTSWLKFHNVPYIPMSAGQFILVDMRPTLSNVDRYSSVLSITHGKDMYEREAVLTRFMIEHGVFLLGGAAFHMEGGWLRIIFSIRRDFLDVALIRMEDALGWERWPKCSIAES